MKLLSIVIISLFCCSLHGQEFILAVGETTTIPAPMDSTVRIGTKKILRAVDEGKRIRLIAMKPGDTTVVIGAQVHRIVVTESRQKIFFQKLRGLLKTRMGLQVQINHGHIEITGELLRFSDWLDLARLSKNHDGSYKFLALPKSDVAKEAITYFKNISLQEKWPHFRLSSEPDIVAQLPAGTKALKPAVERALRPFGIRVELDASQVEVQPLIRTRVILAELSKDISQDLGIEWPAATQAQILPAWQNPSSILLSLRAMESRGLGKVLAAPNLSCKSGAEAQFHAGGEFPIRVINRVTKDIVWKKHGVILNVKPRADYKGHISIDIETEISLLDLSHAVDGIPALKINRVSSHFDLISSKTIALSGLIRQDWSEGAQGLPGLSNIPILGALFGSQKFLNHQSELVVFVTPEITAPDANEEIKMPQGWLK